MKFTIGFVLFVLGMTDAFRMVPPSSPLIRRTNLQTPNSIQIQSQPRLVLSQLYADDDDDASLSTKFGLQEKKIHELEYSVGEKKATIIQHEATIGQLQDSVVEQNATIIRHEATIIRHEATIGQLQESVVEQNATIIRHEATIGQLHSKVAGLTEQFDEQGGILKELLTRDRPITVREAMRRLESALCLDAAGSTTRHRIYPNIDKINRSIDVNIKNDWVRVMRERNLRPDHLAMLGYLKDYGDHATHDRRPVLSRPEWSTLLEEVLADDEDGAVNIANDLLVVLEHYYPLPLSDEEPWQISDPKRKGTIPTRKDSAAR